MVSLYSTSSRTIHQVWFDIGNGADIPTALRPYQDSWKRLRLDFSYKLWTLADAERLVRDSPAVVREIWQKLPHGINKADFFRYVLMHTIGGCYFDLDFDCVSDEFVDVFNNLDGVLLAEESPYSLQTGSLHNGALMSRGAGHPFWSFLFEAIYSRLMMLRKEDLHDKQASVFRLTGTAVLRDVAVDYWRHNLSYRFPLVVVPFGVFCPLMIGSSYVDDYDGEFPRGRWTFPRDVRDQYRGHTYAVVMASMRTWQHAFD
tara:strand:+ start:689 stop:1465 length:777 start_codon:yes stop_codon:yes gene_type:complete